MISPKSAFYKFWDNQWIFPQIQDDSGIEKLSEYVYTAQTMKNEVLFGEKMIKFRLCKIASKKEMKLILIKNLKYLFALEESSIGKSPSGSIIDDISAFCMRRTSGWGDRQSYNSERYCAILDYYQATKSSYTLCMLNKNLIVKKT